mmetsp:Transcript_29763/g.70972  ORF Transcript_29763/g.70972 Transcript_29763/m.70972 type:complete len:547 (-) Transcript_29763:326-1966(-)
MEYGRPLFPPPREAADDGGLAALGRGPGGSPRNRTALSTAAGRQLGGDLSGGAKLLGDAQPYVEAPLRKCRLNPSKADQHPHEVLRLLRLVALHLREVAGLDPLILRARGVARGLEGAHGLLQLRDLAGAVLVPAENLGALLLEVGDALLLLLELSLDGRDSDPRRVPLPQGDPDRRQEREVVVELAELRGRLDGRRAAQSAHPDGGHPDPPRVGGDALARLAAVGVLPAAQPVLVLKLGDLDEGQPDVAEHVADVLEPLDKVLRLARRLRQLHLELDDVRVLRLEGGLLLGGRQVVADGLGVGRYRGLELLEHAHEVVVVPRRLRGLRGRHCAAVVRDQLLWELGNALEDRCVRRFQRRPLWRQRQLAVALEEHPQLRAVGDDRVARQLGKVLLQRQPPPLDEVLGHALPLHDVLLRPRRDKEPALRLRKKLRQLHKVPEPPAYEALSCLERGETGLGLNFVRYVAPGHARDDRTLDPLDRIADCDLQGTRTCRLWSQLCRNLIWLDFTLVEQHRVCIRGRCQQLPITSKGFDVRVVATSHGVGF